MTPSPVPSPPPAPGPVTPAPVTPKARSRRDLALQWFGVLAAPGAWSFMLLTNAFLGESMACSPGSIMALTTGSGVKVAVAAVNAAGIVVSVAALLVSLSSWRRLHRSDADRSPGGRAEWMAGAGVMVSILFLLIIVAAYLPLVFLHPPCIPTP